MLKQRIDEIARQANNDCGNPFDLNYKALDVFLHKFAELIILECAEVVIDTDLSYTGYGDDEILHAAKHQVLKHFGIEK